MNWPQRRQRMPKEEFKVKNGSIWGDKDLGASHSDAPTLPNLTHICGGLIAHRRLNQGKINRKNAVGTPGESGTDTPVTSVEPGTVTQLLLIPIVSELVCVSKRQPS